MLLVLHPSKAKVLCKRGCLQYFTEITVAFKVCYIREVKLYGQGIMQVKDHRMKFYSSPTISHHYFRVFEVSEGKSDKEKMALLAPPS